MYLSWPFAILSISESAVELKVLIWKWRIDSEQLKALHFVKGLVANGVQIHHTSPEAPAEIVFWSTNFKKLEAAIQSLGHQLRR